MYEDGKEFDRPIRSIRRPIYGVDLAIDVVRITRSWDSYQRSCCRWSHAWTCLTCELY
ncbi:MAG: hypothetical protein ACJAY5_001282 [Actinomycetes bacterium]|jgi:hypothetical protein